MIKASTVRIHAQPLSADENSSKASRPIFRSRTSVPTKIRCESVQAGPNIATNGTHRTGVPFILRFELLRAFSTSSITANVPGRTLDATIWTIWASAPA